MERSILTRLNRYLTFDKNNVPLFVLISSLICTGIYYCFSNNWNFGHAFTNQVFTPIETVDTDLTLSASPYGKSNNFHNPSNFTENIDSTLKLTTTNQSEHLQRNYNGSEQTSGLAKTSIDHNVPQPGPTNFSTHTKRTTLTYKPTRLAANRELRVLFDSFLENWRSRNVNHIKNELSEHLSQTYTEEEQQRAEKLFVIYLDYKRQLDKIPSSNNTIDSMVSFFNQMVILRRDVLGEPLANAFFSQDESYDRFTLAREHILGNQKLSELEKNLLISRLENTLPEAELSLPTQNKRRRLSPNQLSPNHLPPNNSNSTLPTAG